MKPTLALTIALALAACGRAPAPMSATEEAWNPRNAPERFGAAASQRFDALPTQATAQTIPWSDDYWSTRHGQTSFRWQTTQRNMSYRSYLYTLPSAGQLASFGEADLARLSPAEKYDLLTGRSDLPLTRADRQRTLDGVRGGDVPAWYGLCHGWAPASFMEPQAQQSVARTLPDGRKLTFLPSDIHALMTRFYGDYHYTGRTTLLGGRCESDGRGRSGDVNCRDVNPGAFHLVLVHQLAEKGESFVAELDNGSEVWNHPVYGYSFQYSRLRAFRPLGDIGRARFRAPGTAYLVDVRLSLQYVTESMPAARPQPAARKTMVLDYSLELDDQQRIIGGEWHTDVHPDFLWRLDRKPAAGDALAGLDYATLRQLLDEAQ